MLPDLALVLNKPFWKNIFTIPQGSVLQKGRHGLYHEIVAAAAQVGARFGCYSWGSDSIIYYCGSFAQDYARGNFKSNLHGRIHNYLQNHRQKETGQKNTNLMIFENINTALNNGNVLLRHFYFDSLKVGGDLIEFNTFSNDPNLVHAVEQLLICSYRRQGQCQWNRT
jgi:hypothetical protein